MMLDYIKELPVRNYQLIIDYKIWTKKSDNNSILAM